MSDDNIILFPTNRIANKETVKHPVDPKQHEKQTNTAYVYKAPRTW